MARNKIIESIGIEFEVEDIPQRIELPRNVYEYFNKDHDASCESDGYFKNGMFFNIPLKKDFQKDLLGTELVSRILDSSEEENIRRPIYDLVNFLSENGESSESFRAGIHIHINMGGYNLNILKNLIKLAAKYEPIFYYLGGMGYEFRGVRNDFTYCRPVTKFGPSCIKIGNYSYQILNIDDLLESKNTGEFFYRYGALNEDSPCGKYTPIRYGWITLYNLLKTETVEFRVFNKCLNPEFILTAIEICKAFCMRSFSSYPIDFEENSIYDLDKQDTKFLFGEMVRDLNLNSKTERTAKLIINQTPEIKLEKKYYYTHLKSPNIRLDGEYRFPKIDEEVFYPEYVDLHVLRGE